MGRVEIILSFVFIFHIPINSVIASFKIAPKVQVHFSTPPHLTLHILSYCCPICFESRFDSNAQLS